MGKVPDSNKVASQRATGASAIVAELMSLVNEAIVASKRDSTLGQTHLLPQALSKVAGMALDLAEEAEMLRHLEARDPRFGLPYSWMRHASLREAIKASMADEGKPPIRPSGRTAAIPNRRHS